ncbi:hypothetical protein HCC61_21575 [Streptomyces sp. HNM0575]|uniref:hypothetical protein n=1 Tax=Streptomyces sp. HNM0575 TaxID=2716338 RepID=UPI00145F365F|nr:hypothetical protein [Streptomyces sp. HNM0575]NLU75226.1 hypothetical protein [Streptomyces sp. HNM0575]
MAMGWTMRDPTDNDGTMPLFFMFEVVVLALYLFLWWIANLPVQRRALLGFWGYWTISALVAIVSSFALPTIQMTGG